MLESIDVRKLPVFYRFIKYNGAMNMNHEQCYIAVQSRDQRFDGLFFTGVKTTGIFCRPVCPARTPKSENVIFFASAAEAANAGFRPCLRCRPECAPESPEWNWSSTIVSRAMRLIADGALEEQRLDEVASQLHLSGRQLRRYFLQELGVPPIKVAQTHRLLFAKKLITETALPMTEIAFIAGYASIRRFNDAFKDTYGRPPTALRKEGVDESVEDSLLILPTGDDQSSILELKLAYRPPYDWAAMLAIQERFALPGVEEVIRRPSNSQSLSQVEGGYYRRALCFGKQKGVIEVRQSPTTNHLLLRIPLSLARHLRTITARIKCMFDLRADPAAIAHHLRSDTTISSLLNRHPGIRIANGWDARERAVQILLAEVMGGDKAQTFLLQVAQERGEVIAENEHLRVVSMREQLGEALRSSNLPDDVSISLRSLIKEELRPATDIEETIEYLQTFGISTDQAHQIALYGMGEPDACPLHDSFPAAQTESWRPWRSYASILLSIDS